MQLRFSVPNEALSLPPPPLLTFPSMWMAGIFWISALVHNGVNRRPALRSGVHRQLLMATLGFCLGYYIKRYSNYYHAERDRQLFSYIKHHPEDFVEKDRIIRLTRKRRPTKHWLPSNSRAEEREQHGANTEDCPSAAPVAARRGGQHDRQRT